MHPTFPAALLASLTKGFVDQKASAPEAHLPQLLVNDRAQGKTVLRALHKHLAECEEFWFSVAFATKGGIMTILHALQALQRRGVRGRILVSQYQNFTQPEALRTLLQFPNLTLKMATRGNYHAKGYLFKKAAGYDLVIGSSNLTADALRFNKEWNLQVTVAEESDLFKQVQDSFEHEFEQATLVDAAFVDAYEQLYQSQKHLQAQLENTLRPEHAVQPNAMQVEALASLTALRAQRKRKALLISATGTGKTYLAAFDVKAVAPAKFLFVVHRTNIAVAALRTFQRVFGDTRTMGLYAGSQREAAADFLFCTIQTLAQAHHLAQFAPDHFDYIVLDETHRSGAESYQRILAHFQPQFLLGMTATPERTDGFDIFQQFDHSLAYEIRLQRALQEDMLCPFHYFGVTDITVNRQVLEEEAAFTLLVAEERINHILQKAAFYGCDNGRVRGLVFCRTVTECQALSEAFNARGLRTMALSGASSEAERAVAISRLESDLATEQLDYLFTVDIFNEGIDIPRLNQVILLRPTQSAIVFVQQLGRGLRKAPDKEYLTVIDFIGNYRNSYLVPIALFGDTTYNKDTLRKLMAAGSSLLPGTSTVNFDHIAQQRIYAAIDAAQLSRHRELVHDYHLLKFQVGHPPMMMDFVAHGARDPFLYVTYAGSYFNFAVTQEPTLAGQLSPAEVKLLALIATNLANAKRIEEVVILQLLLEQATVSFAQVRAYMQQTYGTVPSAATVHSCVRNLNFEFIKASQPVVVCEAETIRCTPQFAEMLAKAVFGEFLRDALQYAQHRYAEYHRTSAYIEGFFLYRKYGRRDVCRILNWDHDESSTLYGYKVKYGSCPLFVNYHKEEYITQSTNYEDGFLNHQEFSWMSKSNRRLDSPEIKAIQAYQSGLRLPLFIKKSNGEGADFYYMGEVTPQQFEAATISDDTGKAVPVVKIKFALSPTVEETMYAYLTSSQS